MRFSRRRDTRALARWLAASVLPLAMLGNTGAYLLSLYLLANGRTAGIDATDAWQIVTVLGLVAFQAVWLVWLRPQPYGTLLASLVLWLAAVYVGAYEPLAVQPGVLFVLFAFATERAGWARSAAVAGAAAFSFVGLVGAYALHSPASAPSWSTPAVLIDWMLVALATIVVPALAGCWYAALRDRAERIAELAQRASRGETARTAEAVAAERRTLAQEIHDTSSAHLAAMLALSTAAETLGDPADPRGRLVAQIRVEGERLYQGFERMLGSMRQEDRTVTETHLPGHRPGQHSASEVVALADEHRAVTGARVTLEHSPDLREIDQRLGPMRAHIAYRVVQEALSNVRKHAPGAAITITMEDDATTLLLRIENDAAPQASRGDAPPARSLSLGYGLEGMRDRLVAASGSLRTGPRQNGGWSVNALLPHPPHQHGGGRATAARYAPPAASLAREGVRP